MRRYGAVPASIPAGSALAADATRTSRDSRHGTGNSGNGSAPNCPNLREQTVPGARHPRATAAMTARGDGRQHGGSNAGGKPQGKPPSVQPARNFKERRVTGVIRDCWTIGLFSSRIGKSFPTARGEWRAPLPVREPSRSRRMSRAPAVEAYHARRSVTAACRPGRRDSTWTTAAPDMGLLM